MTESLLLDWLDELLKGLFGADLFGKVAKFDTGGVGLSKMPVVGGVRYGKPIDLSREGLMVLGLRKDRSFLVQ